VGPPWKGVINNVKGLISHPHRNTPINVIAQYVWEFIFHIAFAESASYNDMAEPKYSPPHFMTNIIGKVKTRSSQSNVGSILVEKGLSEFIGEAHNINSLEKIKLGTVFLWMRNPN
jgi:hypothetical protein